MTQDPQLRTDGPEVAHGRSVSIATVWPGLSYVQSTLTADISSAVGRGSDRGQQPTSRKDSGRRRAQMQSAPPKMVQVSGHDVP